MPRFKNLKVNIIYKMVITSFGNFLMISGAYFLENLTKSVRVILRLPVSLCERACWVRPNTIATSD